MSLLDAVLAASPVSNEATLLTALILLIPAILYWFIAPRWLDGPTVSHIPLLGAALELRRNWDVLPDYILNYSLKFKRTFSLPMPQIGAFNQGAIVLVTPEDVEHVLVKNFENYVKGKEPNQVNSVMSEFLGNGIFASDGAVWKFHRKVASRMFTSRLMRSSAAVMAFHTDRLAAKLGEVAEAGTTVDIQDLFFRLTIDVFAEVAFGIDFKSMERDSQHEFAIAFDEMQALIQKRFCDPLWRLNRLIGTKDEKRLRECRAVIENFAVDVINRKRAHREELGPDLLSRFLDSAEDSEMSNDELRDIVMNFIIAGRDTTACALSWSIHELSSRPDIVASIREELAVHEVTDPYSLQSSAGLPYLHAVVSEVLRLHPSVPKQPKYALHSDTLPGGTRVHPGTAVIYSAYAMGRNPDIWEDPLKFDPMRWVAPAADGIPGKYVAHKEPSAAKFITFNIGKRLCLGKGLAYMEIKMVLSQLLTQFDFVQPEPHSGQYRESIVLPMEGGLIVRVDRRTHAK